MSEEAVKAVLKKHSGRLMALPGVVGTGLAQSEGRPCIKVFVSARTADVQAKIPEALEGYPVVVEETGTFRALGPR